MHRAGKNIITIFYKIMEKGKS